MKVLVMGSGAIGGFYGGLLAQRGHDVTFVARGSHLAALRERGLELRHGEESTLLSPVRAIESPAEAGAASDLVIFAVKGYDTESAARALKPAVGPETAVLTLQNGVDSAEQIGKEVGPEHVLPGTTLINTVVLEPGVIRQNTDFVRITLGEASGEVTPRVERIAEALRDAGVDVTVSTDPKAAIWTKFVMLAPHATITSACQAPLGAIRDTDEGRELYRTLIGEAVAVAHAAGVSLPGDVEEKTFETLMAFPPPTKTSMQVDFERGNRVELNQITGAAVRIGREVGVPTPRFDALYAALKVRALAAGSLSQ
jgi:2-dehydropantoate 2-reductase